MNISNIPQKYLIAAAMIMVVVLVVITSSNPGSLIFKDQTDYEAQTKLAKQEAEQYEALLASIEPNYEASQQLLKKIASEDIVRQEIEQTLNVNQKVTVPTVANSELVFAQRSDRAELVSYMNRLGSMISNYNTDNAYKVAQTFAEHADSSAIASAKENTKLLADNIRGMPVPSDAAELHKAYIVAYQTYGTFLDTASQYAAGANSNPWASVYNQYAVIDNRLATADSELTKLSEKFALNVPMPEDVLAGGDGGFGLIKTAHAQFGLTAVIDIKAAALEGIKAGLARAFAKFAITMLDKLVAHIEKNFAIASQLYYSQDLARFYSVEYMKKFVEDPLDQDIIQKFLPQYFCVNPKGGELKQIFTAKAVANQGTDIVIDPADPQFLTKLARLGGDERNYSTWWEDYYSTLAAQTKSEADAAAAKEVLSPGLKSGRDLVSGQINKTMSSIFNVQEAAISGTINLGTNNAENVISQLVAGVVESMVNKFVFTPLGGGGSANGGIGVIADQSVCLSTPKIKPVSALPQSAIDNQPTKDNVPLPPAGGTPPIR